LHRVPRIDPCTGLAPGSPKPSGPKPDVEWQRAGPVDDGARESFTAAAGDLHVSQPALSEQVRLLEAAA
jgi:hypothetical protein